MSQPSLLDTAPRFDGPVETLQPQRESDRLRAHLRRVLAVLRGGQKFTLDELALLTKVNRGSIGSRVRDLKKLKFGGYDIRKERIADGTYVYFWHQEVPRVNCGG